MARAEKFTGGSTPAKGRIVRDQDSRALVDNDGYWNI